MEVNFYLRNPKSDTSSVEVVVTHRGKRYRKGIGVSVPTKGWAKQKSKDEKINARLRDIRTKIEEAGDYATDEEVKAAMETAISGKTPTHTAKRKETGVPSFWEFFEEWSNRPLASVRQTKNICSLIARTMGKEESWDEIDSAYYVRLVRKLKEGGYSVNYIGSVVSRLKAAVSEGYQLKYTRNDDFRSFHRSTEDSYAVYLNPADIGKLQSFDPPTESLRIARDLFLVGYYTGARYSDYSRLTLDNIKDGRVEFVQNKTGDRVVLPASPKLVAVLKANGGAAPKMNQMYFNREIKEACRLAGIDDEVQLPKHRRKEDGSPTFKWEMVSSHTARRSAATNLCLSGVQMKDIMTVTGHKSMAALERYVRVTKEQSVDRLSNEEFFK